MKSKNLDWFALSMKKPFDHQFQFIIELIRVSDVITLTMGHWLCTTLIYLGYFTAYGAIAIAQGQYIGAKTLSKDIYTKSDAMVELT